MNRDFLYDIQNDLSSWSGDAAMDCSFIRVQNSRGINTPIFWCFQDAAEFAVLAGALSTDTPLYALRSGRLFMEYSAQNIALLSERFIREILLVCLRHRYSSIILGGSCQGAGLMLEVARQLEALNAVKFSFVALELLYFDTLRAPLKLIYGEQSSYNIFRRNHNATEMMNRYFSDLEIHVIPGSHGQYFRAENIKNLARILKNKSKSPVYHLKNTDEKFNDISRLGSNNFSLEQLSELAIDVCLEHNLEASVCEKIPVLLNVTNRSNTPISEQAICLANQWYLSKGRASYKWLDGYVSLPSLAPNESIAVNLEVNAPFSEQEYTLKFRAIDRQGNYQELDTEIRVDVKAARKLNIVDKHNDANRQKQLYRALRCGAMDDVITLISSEIPLSARQWSLVTFFLIRHERWSDALLIIQQLRDFNRQAHWLAGEMYCYLKLDKLQACNDIYLQSQPVHQSTDPRINCVYCLLLVQTQQVQEAFDLLNNPSFPCTNKHSVYLSMLSPAIIRQLSPSLKVKVADKLRYTKLNVDGYLKVSNVLISAELNSEALAFLAFARNAIPFHKTLLLRSARLSLHEGRIEAATFFYKQVLQVSPFHDEALSFFQQQKHTTAKLVRNPIYDLSVKSS